MTKKQSGCFFWNTVYTVLVNYICHLTFSFKLKLGLNVMCKK